MWRTDVRETFEQIGMRPYPILGHLPIGQERNEMIHDIVGYGPTVHRAGGPVIRVIRVNVRQVSLYHPLCFVWRVSNDVLLRVRKDAYKATLADGITRTVDHYRVLLGNVRGARCHRA